MASWLTKVAGLMLLLISLLVCAHVILRGFFNSGIDGVYEIVQYGMLTIVSITLAENELTGGSIVANFILDRMKPRVANIFSIVMYAVAAVTIAVVIYNQIGMVGQKLANGAVTGVLFIPHWILIVIICIGLFFFTIAFLIKVVTLIRNHKNVGDRALTADEIAAEMTANTEF